MVSTSCLDLSPKFLRQRWLAASGLCGDDAACKYGPAVYAVRSFSLAFDLDQQSMGWQAVA